MQEFFSNLVEQWGDLGLFLFSYTESVFQPFPVDPFIVLFITQGSPVASTVFWASLGAMLGAITSYFLGKYLGEPVFLKLFSQKNYHKGEAFFEKWGIWAVLFAAVTPLPFKIIAWLAGIFEMPFLPFIIMTFIGRVGRFVLVGYLASKIV